MGKLKKGFLIITGTSILFLMSACGTEPIEESLHKNTQNESEASVTTTSPVDTESSVIPEIPSETDFEITKDELMELIWRNDELEDVGKIIYPSFELTCEINDGKYYRVFRSNDKGIDICENVSGVEEKFPVSRGEIIIRNSDISKNYSIFWEIGNMNNPDSFTREEKKVFFQDITNDGREELIINLPVFDMTSSKNYLYVFDSLDLEIIQFPDGNEIRDNIGSKVKVNIKDVNDDGLLTADITIDGKTYEAHTEVYEDWRAEDMLYDVGGRGYYIGEKGVYYRTYIEVYHKDYIWSIHNGFIPIDIPLTYNPELNAFEAVEGEYVVHNLR